MMAPEIPAGMVEVRQDEFYAGIKNISGDPMPSVDDSPFYSAWKTRQGRVIGRTYPGWKNPGDPSAYMLLAEHVGQQPSTVAG
jgi:hypothetical protein